MRRSTRLLATVVAVPALTVALAGPALAEDCFNASRSTQGSTSAAQGSGVWWSIPELLSVLGGLTPQQIDAVMPVIEADPRIPSGFTVFYNPQHPGELASRMPTRNAADGRGIDHSDDYATPVFAAIFQDVASVLGG